MENWLITAADKRGAQWIFLVRAERRPSAAHLEETIRGYRHAVEITGQLVDAEGVDFTTLNIVRPDGTHELRGGGPRYTIDGDRLAGS